MSESVFELNDVLLGTQYASLAITDDEEDTLKKVGKMNPWHIEALTLITGSNEEAHKPLSYILDKYMNGLKLDCHIDKVGMTPGGHFLDTQGYIAHNDDTIVLSYRCTTSIFDWLTNLNAGSSEWELDEDIAQGFSGKCSEWEGICCKGGKNGLLQRIINSVPNKFQATNPRVHTGFYNNFLATVPEIKKYIEPLLAEDQPPRKLFVCGHSLGAGIATLAGCYFLLQHDWSELPHQLIIVTVGSPRACQNSMKEVVQAEVSRLKTKGCSDKVMTYRVVRDQDLVTTLPPSFLGYYHLDNLVFIFEDGSIDFVADGEEANGDEVEISAAVREVPSSFTSANDDDDENDTPYEEKIQNIPKAIRDHMPDFYLKPMLVARLQK